MGLVSEKGKERTKYLQPVPIEPESGLVLLHQPVCAERNAQTPLPLGSSLRLRIAQDPLNLPNQLPVPALPEEVLSAVVPIVNFEKEVGDGLPLRVLLEGEGEAEEEEVALSCFVRAVGVGKAVEGAEKDDGKSKGMAGGELVGKACNAGAKLVVCILRIRVLVPFA